MRAFWKSTEKPLSSHADWRERISRKNRRPGTSAPTLAEIWAGPVELFGALRQLPVFAGIALEQVIVEKESAFDEYGGPRNHDLVAYARLPDGDRVVICVEAKAGENLGETVEQYRAAAQAKLDMGESTNALKRLEKLLGRYDKRPEDEGVGKVRYQLLSALAGTHAEAKGAQHAVLMIHEFMTDERPKDKTLKHMEDLRHFCKVVLGNEPPVGLELPWCFELPAASTKRVKLYIAWAGTDLTSAALE